MGGCLLILGSVFLPWRVTTGADSVQASQTAWEFGFNGGVGLASLTVAVLGIFLLWGGRRSAIDAILVGLAILATVYTAAKIINLPAKVPPPAIVSFSIGFYVAMLACNLLIAFFVIQHVVLKSREENTR